MAEPLLRGLALAGWVSIVIFHLTLLTLDIIRDYPNIITPCEGTLGFFGSCGEQLALSSAEIVVLESWGLSLQGYALYMLSLVIIGQIINLSVSLLILWQERASWLGLTVSLFLVLVSSEYYGGDDFASIHPNLLIPSNVLMAFNSFLNGAFLYLMPNGRFSPRWAKFPFLLTFILFAIFGLSLNGVPFPDWLSTIASLWIGGSILLGIAFQIFRYIKTSNQVERQQTKWVILGVVVFFSTIFVWILTFGGGISIPNGRPLLISNLSSWTYQFAGAYFFPIAMMIAITRYRLWDIDIIISRALIYAGLTVTIVAIYTVIVGGLSTLFQTSGNLVISLIATGLIAVIFQPVRERLQRWVNRLMYGERDDPYAVLSQLNQQLQGAAVPSETLRSIVETIAEQLKLPFVSVELFDNEQQIGQAAVGTPLADTMTLPLRYQKETVGRLIVSRRAADEPFTPQEERLLADIAAQIGPAASATRLTMALQHSRENLVLAREEERLRIRRDLHDGLGPTLASQTLQFDSLTDKLDQADPEAAKRLVAQLKGQTQRMVSDIRRLVYALRPPALDELGLLDALRAHVSQMEGHDRLAISVSASPDPLTPLPAAIEVAAYRIALEGVTNVLRHAQASRCTIEIDVQGTHPISTLTLTISDDGVGLPAKLRSGVGLSSMRERAEELGGAIVIESTQGEGTRIEATLPFTQKGEA